MVLDSQVGIAFVCCILAACLAAWCFSKTPDAPPADVFKSLFLQLAEGGEVRGGTVIRSAQFMNKIESSARALELLLLGAALARTRPAAALPSDVWTHLILPRVIERRSQPGGVGENGKLLPLLSLQARNT